MKSWFEVPTSQMPIFVLFVSTAVLFDGAFFPVSILNRKTEINVKDESYL